MQPTKVRFPLTITEGSASVKIYRGTNRGRDIFTLVYSVGGRRERKNFANLADAKTEARATLTAILNGQVQVLSLTATDRESYVHARKHVDPLGIPLHAACEQFASAHLQLAGKATLAEAVAYFMRHANPDLPRRTVAEVLREMLTHKQTVDKVSALHLKDLRLALTPVAERFGVTPIAQIPTSELNQYVSKVPGSKRTRANARAAIVTLWNFAKDTGYLASDRETAAEQMAKIKGGKVIGKIEIFTAEEVRGILAKQDFETVPFAAIHAFSGIRNEEIGRLRWADFDWQNKVIHVGADRAKTQEERFVPILPILEEWLKPYRHHECTGPINFGHSCIQEMVQKRAAKECTNEDGKVTVPAIAWKRNALRHSFVSYRLADVKNIGQVAEEAGNSPAMIRKHYRKPILPADCAAYWGLLPTEEQIRKLIDNPIVTAAHRSTQRRRPDRLTAIAPAA